MKDNGLNYDKEAAVAKVFASETALKTSAEAVQIHGGYGFVKEYHVERLMRDAGMLRFMRGHLKFYGTISRSVLK